MENKNGNLPIENENIVTREEVVAGRNVEVIYDKDDTEFTSPKGSSEPEGLEGEELDQWKANAGNEFKMKSSANDKYAEAAKMKREIEDLKAKFEREKQNWEAQKSTYKPQVEIKEKTKKPEWYDILSEVTGETIRDIDDELEFEEDNKKLYRKAKRVYEQKKDDYILSLTQQTVNPKDLVEKSLLRNKIEQDGNDYASIEAFAKLRGWDVNSYSYDAFKNANPDKTSKTEKINKFAQKTDFIWIPKGEKVASAKEKPLSDMFDNIEQLEDWVEEEMKKDHPDPRAIKFMKDND